MPSVDMVADAGYMCCNNLYMAIFIIRIEERGGRGRNTSA
jgi:hypothetical protein